MTVKRFASRPVEIEAIQFKISNLEKVQDFVGVLEDGDTFGFRMTKDRRVHWDEDEIVAKVYDVLHDTWVGVKRNQWIIRGTLGEFYPCDDNVFTAKYQEIDNA